MASESRFAAFDTLDGICNRLQAGEDSRAGFKKVVLEDRGVCSPSTEDMAGEMVAFANSEGYPRIGLPMSRPGSLTSRRTTAIRPFDRS